MQGLHPTTRGRWSPLDLYRRRRMAKRLVRAWTRSADAQTPEGWDLRVPPHPTVQIGPEGCFIEVQMWVPMAEIESALQDTPPMPSSLATPHVLPTPPSE